jgi:dihydroorotate dehydrogenase
LHFRNPVGLAAGYDKDGLGWRGLACLGFGHIEIGTVTLKAQPGNPQPRLFRLVEDQALINRMGFPGKGANFVARQLAGKRPPDLVIGVNLGKNKETALEEAPAEYAELMEIFAPLADYLAINVSSPNTVGLRRLQARDALDNLLSVLAEKRTLLSQRLQKQLPLLVKLAPDLSIAELDDALDVVLARGMDGVIATNTTLSRDQLKSRLAGETGGLSGTPLRSKSWQMVNAILEKTEHTLPVVGVGGIMNPATAREFLSAGAALVQVYTGLVYSGPALVKEIVSSVSQLERG